MSEAIPAVAVSGLVKTYATPSGAPVVAVDHVDLAVAPGELVVLLGPSGCGKTSLLRSIAGLELPDGGSIAIEGRTVYDAARRSQTPPQKRGIGMMFQSYALWPHMSVFDNVAYPLRSRGLRREETSERILGILDELGVGGLDRRYPGELSGGQQQRIALARALVAEPRIMLFDEPLSNVDARVRRNLRALIREVKQRTGFAGVYVTHDQEEAMELADRLAVMKEGRIVQLDRPDAVYRSPATSYIAEFVGDTNRLPGTVLDAGGDTMTVEAAGVRGEIPRAAGARTGDEGWLACRPEDVTIVAPPSGAADPHLTVRAVVADDAFLGPRRELRCRIGETRLTAWTDPWREELPAGSEVDLHIPTRRIQWLSA